MIADSRKAVARSDRLAEASVRDSNHDSERIRPLVDLLRGIRSRYCVLHGWAPSLTQCSDLDIAVAPESFGELEASLRRSAGVRLIQVLQHEASCYYWVLAVQREGTVRLSTLDVAVDYRRDGRVFLTEEALLRHRRQVDGLWVAAPEVEFAYLMVKKIMKGVLPDHQKTRMRALCGSLGLEAEVVARRLLGARWGREVIDWFLRPDLATLEAHLPTLRRVMRREVVRRDPLNPIRYWLPEIRRRSRRWWHPTGLCVAVLGPDGAGKSTLIARLVTDLSAAFRRADVFHLRPGLLKRRAPQGPATDPHAEPPYPFWRSVLKLLYYALDHTMGYAVRVRPRLTRSALVLFDRYYHDVLVDPRRYRYGASPKLAWFMRRFVPQPDLVFILDVPEGELWRRKQEVSQAELRRQREAYRRLADSLPGAVLLDGSRPPDEVVGTARQVVLEVLHRRYEQRRCMWFGTSDRAARGSSSSSAPAEMRE